MRKKLVNLTGSSNVRANDRDYMDKLRHNIWQEHEADFKRKEAEREENERQRMRKLMARGIIGPEDLRDDPILYGEYKHKAILVDQRYSGKRRKKSPRRKDSGRINRVKSAPPPKLMGPPPQPRAKESSDLSRQYSINKRPSTAIYSSDSSSRSPRRRGRSDTGSSHSSVTLEADNSLISTITQDVERTSLNSDVSSRTSTRRSRYEHPIVRQMRREETVEGLYELAEQAYPLEAIGQNKYVDSKKKGGTSNDEYAYDPNKKVKIKF